MRSLPIRKRRIALGLAVLFVLGGVLLLRTQRAWEGACTAARRELPKALGMEVGIGRCEIEPLTQAVRLYGVSAFQPGVEAPVFSVDSAEVRLRAFQPFFGGVKLELVQLDHPRVNVDLVSPRPSAPVKKGSRPAAPKRCVLEDLSELQIDKLVVKNAEVRVALPQGRRAEVSGVDLRWKVRRGVAELELEGRQGVVALGDGAGELSMSRLIVDAALDPRDLQLEVTRGEVGLDDFTVSASGKVENLCDPQFFLDGQIFAPLRTVARATGWHEQVKGHLWAGVSASGKLPEPNVSVDLVGADVQLGAYKPGDFTAKLAWSGKDVRLTDVSIPVGPGTVRASGQLTLGNGFPLKLKADVDNAEFGRALEKAGLPGAWVNFFATGKVTAQGKLSPFQLTGDADLKTRGFVLASRPFDAPINSGRTLLNLDSGRVVTSVRALPDRFDFVSYEITAPGSRLVGDGTLFYDTARGLEFKGKAEALNLDDLKHIAGVHWAGTGSATYDIRGPYRDVKIDGALSLRDAAFWDLSMGVVQAQAHYADDVLRLSPLTGQKGQTQYFGRAELDFTGRELWTRVDVQLPSARVEDVVDLVAPIHSSIELFQGPLVGHASGTVHLDSPASRTGGYVELALSNVTYYGRQLGSGGGRLEFHDGQTLDLTKFNLDGPVGHLSGSGVYDLDGPLDFKFRGDELSLAQMVGAEQAKALGLSATMTLAGKVLGDDTVPLVSAYLTAPRVLFAQKNVGDMHLEAQGSGRDLQIFGSPLRDARTSIHLKLKDPVPYEATLSLTLPEIRPLLPNGAISQGVSGALSGTLTAQGLATEPLSSTVHAQVERLTLGRGDFAGQNDGPIVLTYADHRWDVDAFNFKGPNTQLSLSGTAAPEELALKLEGALDMRLLESFVPTLERTGGKVEVTATAGGRMDNPSLLGNARIHDARLTVRDQPISLRGLSGELEFSESRVLLHDVNGMLNDGRIALRGDARLKKFALDRLELGAQLDEVTFRIDDDLPMVTSGELLLDGKPDAMVLSGSLDVVKLRYDKQLVLESFLSQLATASAALPSAPGEKPREWLRLDVAVHLGDVRVDNNLARAQLVGDLKLTGNNVHTGVLGTVEAAEGSQAFFRGNRFTVSQGILEFKDRTSLDMVFDMHAETQVREYQVKLHAFGKTRSPQVVLTADPELAEGDILSLLTLGVTSKDKSATSVTGAGLAAEAIFSATGLDRQVQRFLPKNPLLRDLSFHLATTYNGATGLVEPAAQLESKLGVDQLKLSMTRPVTGKGTHAQVEYRFDNGLSAQAQWDDELSENQGIGNLGLDLKLRWEVE